MDKTAHITGADDLIAKLEKTIENIRKGETVGVAWIEREKDGGYTPHWWSLNAREPANRTATGHFIGCELLRCGVNYLAACMDHDTLKDCGEACRG
jgi:hypothetical protein